MKANDFCNVYINTLTKISSVNSTRFVEAFSINISRRKINFKDYHRRFSIFSLTICLNEEINNIYFK